MVIRTYVDRLGTSHAAARHAARAIRKAIEDAGSARVVAATGASQLDFLAALTATPGVDWSRVELFHLDEYIGLPIDHPASFRKYLLERLIGKAGIRRYHLLDGERDVLQVIDDVGREIGALPISRPTSRSPASARTVTLRSTILPPISTANSRTSSLH